MRSPSSSDSIASSRLSESAYDPDALSLVVLSDSQAAYRHRYGDFTDMVRNHRDGPTTLYNCSAPMHTSQSIRAYLPSLMSDIPTTADIYMIWLGGNDAILEGTPTGRHVPLAEYKANIRSIIESINDRAIKDGKTTEVVLVTPAPLDLEGMPGLRDRYKLERVFSDSGTEDDTASSPRPSRRPTHGKRRSYSGLASAWRKGGSNAHTASYARTIMDLSAEIEKEISEGGFAGISLSTINLWNGMTSALDSGTRPEDLLIDGMHVYGEGYKIFGRLLEDAGVPGLSTGTRGPAPHVVNLGEKIPHFAHYLTLSPSQVAKSYNTGQHSSALYRHALPALVWTLSTDRKENTDRPLLI